MKKSTMYTIQFAAVTIVVMLCFNKSTHSQSSPNCVPGWNGTVLIDCESTSNWSVEANNGSSGTITTITGFIGNAVQLNWNIGTGDWVQAKYTFPQPLDLSQKDIFGLSLRGSPSDLKDVDLMFADVNNVFYGAHFEGISNIQRWMKNLALPKKLFYWYFQTGPITTKLSIDWSQIDRFFVVVKRLNNVNPLSKTGQLAIDHLQTDRAADWVRQQQFDIVTNRDTTARNKAVQYIINQQQSTGLCVSWKEELEPKAWLYDQALALIVLTREGIWLNGIPQNEAALSAKALVDFITSRQKTDGHWPRAWNPVSGVQIVDDLWVGDQAWWVIAAVQYVAKSQDMITSTSVQRGADWLAVRISANGALVPSTEGNVDTWWAMIATERFVEASKIQTYLLNKVWDLDLQYWWRGLYNDSIPDPFVAMDCASWISEFAKNSYVQKPELSKAALSFVHRTLLTSDSSESRCGFDGMGPVSIWCEGTAQYIVAGGEDSQQFLDMLLTLQRLDGGMPGSLDNLGGNAFGWLSNWTGLSSTAWLYFALSESPFPNDSTTGTEMKSQPPQEIVLQQNYPNPFNSSTLIKFDIAKKEWTLLKVFDALGNEVRTLVNEEKSVGTYELTWNAANLPSGVYFYRLQAGSFVETKKMLYLK